MPSRRSTPRSHHGCHNCKLRHVKCDEMRPSCARCRARREPCSLTPDLPGTDVQKSRSVRLVRNDGPVALDVLDRQLWRNYFDKASRLINETEHVSLLFEHCVPALAAGHTFLFHGLLAISGAHRMSVAVARPPLEASGDCEFSLLSSRSLLHQNTAISLFNKKLNVCSPEKVSIEDSVAICLACIFMLLFPMTGWHAMPRDATDSSDWAIEHLAEMLKLQSGINTVFGQYGTQLECTVLKPLLTYLRDERSIAQPTNDVIRQSLEDLRAFCESSRALSATYTPAVDGLARLHEALLLNPNTMGPRIAWTSGELARQLADDMLTKRHEALLILMHWVAFQVRWPCQWWNTIFYVVALESLISQIPAELASLSNWPKAVLASFRQRRV